MSKVISTNQSAPNIFTVDYLVDADEFTKIKEESLQEAIKDVEVEGFRKGKAPKELAASKISPAKLENIILEKTFKTHEKPAVDAGRTELEKQGRHVIQIVANFADGATKELEDGSFQFQLQFKLLPKIDVSKITNIKIKPVQVEDIPGRPKLEDFVQMETDRVFCNYNRYDETDKSSQRLDQVIVDLIGKEGKEVAFEEKGTKILLGLKMFLPELEEGLIGVKKGGQKEVTANFPKNYPNQDLAGKKIKITAHVKSVLAPQYKNMDEVFEKSKQSSQIQQQFGSAEQVGQILKSLHERETQQQVQNLEQRQIIEEVMKVVPDFDMNEEQVSSEVQRLLENVKRKMEENKITIGEQLVATFPNIEAKDPAKMTEKQVTEKLEEQVREEFKWASILSFVYQVKVEDKPKTEDFDQVIGQATESPEKYNFAKDTPKEKIEQSIVDRIVRQVAFTWISTQVQRPEKKTKEEKTEAKSKAKESEKKPAKKAKKE